LQLDLAEALQKPVDMITCIPEADDVLSRGFRKNLKNARLTRDFSRE